MPLTRLAVLAWLLVVVSATHTGAQGFSSTPSKPRPWARISFFTNSATSFADGAPTRQFSELSTAFAYRLPELDTDGADYGADLRYATYAPSTRPNRAQIYEGFIGVRAGGGRIRARFGHVFLNEVGSLGSLAGGMFEVRQRQGAPDRLRTRVGVFGGLEPNVLDVGYADGVAKVGGYAAVENAGLRRHSAGYVLVKHGALIERSVVTTSHFLPIGKKVFVYQAAEVNVQHPDGMAARGLAYFFVNGRANVSERLELQGTYNRGRSIDARGLGDEVLNGRPVTQLAVEGLLYESLGGRATVEVVKGARVYGGYSRDKNNRDADATGRTLIGGHAGNVRGSGFDVSGSESLMQRPSGSYHSRYVSVGRPLGRRAYVSGDYTTSLSVIRYSRSDGITIETRPHTTRVSGTASVNLERSVSLLATVEETRGDSWHEFRVLSGLTYRFR